jgi:hypothetical protein
MSPQRAAHLERYAAWLSHAKSILSVTVALGLMMLALPVAGQTPLQPPAHKRVRIPVAAVVEWAGDLVWFWIGSHAEYDKLVGRQPAHKALQPASPTTCSPAARWMFCETR